MPESITHELMIIITMVVAFIILIVLYFRLSAKLHDVTNLLQSSKEDEQALMTAIRELRETQLARYSEFSLQMQQRFDQMNHLFREMMHETQKTLSDLAHEQAKKIMQEHNRFEQTLYAQVNDAEKKTTEQLNKGHITLHHDFNQFKDTTQRNFSETNDLWRQQHAELRDKLVNELRQSIKDIRAELTQTLTTNSDNLVKSMTALTESNEQRLKDISGQVEKRLTEGFEKTTQTFTDVLKRLALIDDAQKKITELSTNVVSLQEVLADKRSRGTFGEIQLERLIRNVLPEKHFAIQHKLSNDKIADCVLFLPEPTGNVVIDSKFPLESYQKMTDFEESESERALAARQFRQDVKVHINHIKERYIIPGETAVGAMMFIPAEAVFAEIHAHHSELVEYAYKEKIWLVSPTTVMAVLTTASAVIKDEATRHQVHIIQEHLGKLGEDFARFQERMNNLSKHIGQVSQDVDQINISAKKISSRFNKIEKVELNELEVEQEEK